MYNFQAKLSEVTLKIKNKTEGVRRDVPLQEEVLSASMALQPSTHSHRRKETPGPCFMQQSGVVIQPYF